MEKKILLALDDSLPSRWACNYAAQLATVVTDMRYVLFHVQPMVSQFLEEEARRSASAKKKLESLLQENAHAADLMLDKYKQQMVAGGIPADRIETITRRRHFGYAKDILETAEGKPYDAIVVGRRGLSGLARMYAGSVTSDILEQSQVIPVWLVDGEAQAGDILLALDGSEASMRAVDHVGFILSGSTAPRLTLLHVTGNARKYCEIDLEAQPDPELEEMVVRGERACIENFLPHALKKLQQFGITEDRVQFESIQGPRQLGRAIRDFARQGGYHSVVVGRRGMDKSFFMGSVSRYMIDKIADAALWVVP